ncbi:phage terminase large subunit [Candidatus Bathyarchaeota archaeon A05DMB-2]|nr:phage terminase large subunit [Candidatus Bathyarchaeota archaeon A05DMB-2]
MSRKNNICIHPPELHELQREVAEDPSRFKVLSCGRRWGKTKLCAFLAIREAINLNKNIWWVAPTYAISSIGFREVEILARQLPGFDIQRGRMRISCELTGSVIQFKSSEREQNLRGEGLDLLIMDEAAYQPQRAWEDVLRPALADKRGKAIFISTPNKENDWFHKLWKFGASQNDIGIKSWKFPTYTNPYIDKKEIEILKTTLSELTFQREILAEFVSAAGTRIKSEHIKYIETVPEDATISMGVDLAISEKEHADYTAIAVLARDSAGNVYIIDVVRFRGNYAMQKKTVLELCKKYNPVAVGVEDVGYQRVIIQDLSAESTFNFVPIRPTADKVTRFAPLESRYVVGQVYHKTTLNPDFEKELLAFPIAEHDDQVDAVAYAFLALGDIEALLPEWEVPNKAIVRRF